MAAGRSRVVLDFSLLIKGNYPDSGANPGLTGDATAGLSAASPDFRRPGVAFVKIPREGCAVAALHKSYLRREKRKAAPIPEKPGEWARLRRFGDLGDITFASSPPALYARTPIA
jgi:hypothetical protein